MVMKPKVWTQEHMLSSFQVFLNIFILQFTVLLFLICDCKAASCLKSDDDDDGYDDDDDER